MHLTNYSVNKKSSNFVANDDADACVGNKWGMTALMNHLKTELGLDTDAIWADMNWADIAQAPPESCFR